MHMQMVRQRGERDGSRMGMTERGGMREGGGKRSVHQEVQSKPAKNNDKGRALEGRVDGSAEGREEEGGR